jgi:speckle-type POZ protein
MSLSTEYPVETVDTECTRPVRKVTGSHKFRIMGYSLDKDMGKGEFLESTIFNVGGYDWSIQYYPNGYTSAKDDSSISIFLKLKSNTNGVKVQVGFSILDQFGSTSKLSETAEIRNFKTIGNDWGFRSFAKKAELEPYIRDDCLVIKGTVTIFNVFPVKRTGVTGPIIVPPGNIQHNLGHLLETGNGTDVTFEVNGTKFGAHKCILAARSPVFLAQFFGPMKGKSDVVIKVEEIEAPVFKSLLHFIYCDSIPEFEENEKSNEEQDTRLMAEHLLVAADRYGLERLKITCQKILYDTIDNSNVVSLLFLAERHNCIHLRKACLKFFLSADKIGEVIEIEEFQQLVKNDPIILKELLEKRA